MHGSNTNNNNNHNDSKPKTEPNIQNHSPPPLLLPLKIEPLDQEECIDINNHNKNNNNDEEKEASNDLGELSYCRGLTQTPLAVPMVATTLDKSVTRNDAKAITSTRLKRLKELSQRPEEHLSKHQKHEKNRIIRLEKNRRAAAMSRRKKKMYVKNLEDKCELMARHLAVLEMENAQLRALINASHHNINGHSIPVPHQMAAFKRPNMPQFQISPTNFGASSNNNTSPVSDATNSKELSSEEFSSEPSLKRRKLNSGNSLNATTPSSSVDISLEPLPINTECDDKKTILSAVPPSIPINYMQIPPQNHPHPRHHPHIHPHSIRMMPYPPHYPHHMRNIHHQGQIHGEENKMIEKQSDNNDVPPAIDIPPITDEYLAMLDDDIIEETVDECGSVIGVEKDIKHNVVYL